MKCRYTYIFRLDWVLSEVRQQASMELLCVEMERLLWDLVIMEDYMHGKE